MPGHNPDRKPAQKCAATLRDETPCQAVAVEAGYCQHHAAINVGRELGWGVRGSRKANLYVAEQGDKKLYAASSKELLELIRRRASNGHATITSSPRRRVGP